MAYRGALIPCHGACQIFVANTVVLAKDTMLTLALGDTSRCSQDQPTQGEYQHIPFVMLDMGGRAMAP